MKELFARILAKWKVVVLPALLKMGFWGVGLVALLDSSSIPVPMDAIIAVYVWNDKPHFWLYCLMAAVGSAIGGLVPYGLGRAGGELFLLKRIDEAKLKRIRDRFEKQEFLALMVPAMLPPPTPFKLFVFSAGVFEMKPIAFLLAVTIGRLVRFGVLSVLTIVFGPQIVAQTKTLVKTHPSVLVLIVVGVVLIGYLIFRLLRRPAKEIAEEIEHEDAIKQK